MKTLDNDTLKKIMLDCFKKLGPKTWSNKESIIFRLKSEYGDIFKKEQAYKIYDEIYDEIYGKYMEDKGVK